MRVVRPIFARIRTQHLHQKPCEFSADVDLKYGMTCYEIILHLELGDKGSWRSFGPHMQIMAHYKPLLPIIQSKLFWAQQKTFILSSFSGLKMNFDSTFLKKFWESFVILFFASQSPPSPPSLFSPTPLFEKRS